MMKRNIKWVAGIVLMVAAFAFIGGSWSSAYASDNTMRDCVDTYAGGPDFLFNAKPESLKIAYGGNCLAETSVDDGPTFLVNAHAFSSGSQESLAACPQVQSGAPTFLVNSEPTANPEVAIIEGKCLPG